MTTAFIIIIFAIIIIYDIAMAILKKEYITTVFRKWFVSKPIVPMMFGILIGHFQVNIIFANVPLFIILSGIYLFWCIIMSGSNIPWSRKWYDLNCKYFIIPLLQGFICGCMWH